MYTTVRCANTFQNNWYINPLPAELPRMIHVGTSLDVAFVWIIDSCGSSIGSSQDEYKTI